MAVVEDDGEQAGVSKPLGEGIEAGFADPTEAVGQDDRRVGTRALGLKDPRGKTLAGRAERDLGPLHAPDTRTYGDYMPFWGDASHRAGR